MIGFIKKLLSGSNDAEIRRLDKIVAKIDALLHARICERVDQK